MRGLTLSLGIGSMVCACGETSQDFPLWPNFEFAANFLALVLLCILWPKYNATKNLKIWTLTVGLVLGCFRHNFATQEFRNYDITLE